MEVQSHSKRNSHLAVSKATPEPPRAPYQTISKDDPKKPLEIIRQKQETRKRLFSTFLSQKCGGGTEAHDLEINWQSRSITVQKYIPLRLSQGSTPFPKKYITKQERQRTRMYPEQCCTTLDKCVP